jgi:type II secretory pathway pseudopilin PulG
MFREISARFSNSRMEMEKEERMAFCAACGNSLTEGERFCRVCGRDSTSGAPPAQAAGAPTTPAAPVIPAKTSGKAIASLLCGLLFFIPFLFVVAIVLGHLALSEMKRSAGRLKGEGLAIAGLVLGYGWVIFIPIILIIAAIAIPNLLRARMAANESSAVASVRTITTAEISYSSEHPTAGFTCSLSDLSSFDKQLVSGPRNGYAFELSGCTADDKGAMVHYQVAAYPVTRNQSGIRAFCSDETAVVRVDPNGSAQECLANGSPLSK